MAGYKPGKTQKNLFKPIIFTAPICPNLELTKYVNMSTNNSLCQQKNKIYLPAIILFTVLVLNFTAKLKILLFKVIWETSQSSM